MVERSKFGAGTTEADDRSRTKQAGREAIEVVPAQGDVLTVAQLAGIMGAKQCAAVVPLCHNVFLSYVDVKLKLAEADHSVHVTAEVHTNGPTGLCPARTWAYCNAQRASSPGGGRGGGVGGAFACTSEDAHRVLEAYYSAWHGTCTGSRHWKEPSRLGCAVRRSLGSALPLACGPQPLSMNLPSAPRLANGCR